MLYRELFAASLQQLKKTELSTAVEALIERSFAISRTQFWIRKNQPITDRAGLKKYRRYFARLLGNEPLAYILKEKEFYGERIAVSPAVLIPRPETELLVEKALELIGAGTPRVLDIGAGSGNISIVLALKSRATLTASDISRAALRVLKKNVERFGLNDRIRVCRADLFPENDERFDLIVANPPYLSRRDWDRLPPGIQCFEPRTALLAGPDGTETLARIIAGAGTHLSPGGQLLLEIGQGQVRAVRAFLKAGRFNRPESIRDYGGIERVIVAGR